jgi:SagB-type dehydrogenase family enzyme
MTARDLDETSFPAWRDAIARHDADAIVHEPRAYPGYPRHALPRARWRLRSSLERALAARRSARSLALDLPAPAQLGRIVDLAHRARHADGRGAVPSAGGLHALELYAIVLADGWLPAGLYHYDRVDHALARVAPAADRGTCERELVPSLATVDGGALAWVIVGDRACVAARYTDRAGKFLLLEAGHLMQNLCLACADIGLATVPLGGFFERALARAFQLPATDDVLYVGLCGRPVE